MKKELEDKLTKKFPFYTKYVNPFRFDCDDGWYPLLEELSEKIQKVIEEYKIETFTVSQIKEKYGSLRYYHFGAIDQIQDIIDEYEIKSETICERCGNKGSIKNLDGWYKCVCNDCLNYLLERNKNI